MPNFLRNRKQRVVLKGKTSSWTVANTGVLSFNPDPSKQAQEVIFTRKTKKEYNPFLAFNNNNVSETNSHKHLDVVLNNRFSFEDHLKMILNKVNKIIGLLHKLLHILTRSALITIYKTFIRPHLDYGDIIYDQVYSNHFIKSYNRSNQRHFKGRTI